MSKVTVVSRPNRITIASKGVQGAPGPQGEQGIQGPKGDIGDVTPEAIAARDAAQEAASDAADSANLAEQARLLGATIGFATKADMDASLAHAAGTLALVTSDATAANNGTYRKTGASGSGAWVQSADRVTGLEGRTAELESAVVPASPVDDVLLVADADGKEVARIDGFGSLHLPAPPRFPVDDALMQAVNRTQRDPGSDDIYVVTDADGKIVLRAAANGDLYGPRGILPQAGSGGGGGVPDAGTVSAYDRRALPYRNWQAATVVADSIITNAIQHTTTIYGYETGGVPRSKVVTNDSLTHPKVLWIPGGWNGYEYWMAVTPYFGQSWGSESENPHILASNDQINWQEIPSGPLEIAPSAPDYWSDTHLTLGDDGFLYCIYRGMGAMVGGGTEYYMKRSRDGVNWTDRTHIGNASQSVSPVLEPAQRGGFDYFEVGSGMVFPSGKREIVRAWVLEPGVLPARSAADAVTLVNRPWETEYPRSPGEEYDLWHFDSARVGNVYIGIICCRVKAGSGGVYLNYFCWSSDGWVWEVIPGVIGTELYRSSIVPVSFTQNRVICDAYLARTTGVISVRRFTLEFS